MSRRVAIATVAAITSVVVPGTANAQVTDPPVVTITSVEDVRPGDTVTVTYDPTLEIPDGDPALGTTVTPRHFVGICDADLTELFEIRSSSCAGVDLDIGSGTVEIPIERFIDDAGRPLDCVAAEFGCVVGYFYGYDAASDDGGFDIIALHTAVFPIAYAQEESINEGAPVAPAGQPVSIETVGSPTRLDGAVAFAMVCGLDGGGLETMFCDPDVGSVEVDFDGAFSGSINMPTRIANGDATQDCTVGRGCIIVFAVIDLDLQPLYGSGQWVRALLDG